MAPQEPEGTVSSAAPPTLERCVCFQEVAKGGGALAAAAAQTRGLSSECLSKMPPTRMVPIKPAASPAKIAAKLVKQVQIVEEARAMRFQHPYV